MAQNSTRCKQALTFGTKQDNLARFARNLVQGKNESQCFKRELKGGNNG